MKEISVNLYCDEIKECKLKLPLMKNTEKWTYMGILIVPDSISTRLYTDLVNLRCLAEPPKIWNSCEAKCKWHYKNNTEIHYQGVDDTIKYKIACKWVDYWLNDKEYIYYYIFGINLTNLDLVKFGSKEQQDIHSTVYNRFFRTAIKSAIKFYFFDYDRITINDIYHDEGNQEHHKYFPWHSIFRLQLEADKLYFIGNRIKFISSDHRKSDKDEIHSHFIQFIDLVLGCFMNCLHVNSKNANKLNLAKQAYPLVSRLIKAPYNPNSRYNYYRRQSIEFFPKENLKGLDENSLEFKYKRLNQFYTNRILPIKDYITGQTLLFEVINESK